MRVLVFSDVHGNLPALEDVLKKEKSVDLVISLGDVVNYGPWSSECVDLLDSVDNKILLKGNHEEAFISGIYVGENIIAKTFFDQCYSEFNKKDKICSYIEKYELGNYEFRHTLNDEYIFFDTEVDIYKSTFIGHSHRLFTKIMGNYRLVNVGSLGQNRLNIDEINYIIWDTETDNLELIRRTFSANSLIKEMKKRKFPDICINYLLSKRNS